MLHAKSLP
jgi:hypothetical protein